MTQIATVDWNDPKAPERFTESLLTTGFGVIAQHPVDPQLIHGAYAHWRRFFERDEEDKARYAYDRATHSGFFAMNVSETAKGYDQKDLKEFYHYYDGWGPCPEHQLPITRALYADLQRIAVTLLQWVERCTPEDVRSKFHIPLGEMITDSRNTLFRILHYPPLQGDEAAGAVRAAPHEDINLLTVLPAATAPGLEVMNSERKWVAVPCDPGQLVVNIGDMLGEASGNYYRATTHRVVNPSTGTNTARYSMPLFLHPRDDVRLSARHTAKSYLDERLRELGFKN